MAKKSFKSKRKSSDLFQVIGGAIAGGVLANVVKKTVLGNMSSTVQNGVVLAAGVAIPMFVDHKLVDAAGAGMVAVGGAGLATEYIPGLAGIAGFDHAIGEAPRATMYRTIADTTREIDGEKKNGTEIIP